MNCFLCLLVFMLSMSLFSNQEEDWKEYINTYDYNGEVVYKNNIEINYTMNYNNKVIPVRFDFTQLQYLMTVDVIIEDSLCVDLNSKVKFSLEEGGDFLVKTSNKKKQCNGKLTIEFDYEEDRDKVMNIILGSDIKNVSLIIDGKTYLLESDEFTNGDLLYLFMQFYTLYSNK